MFPQYASASATPYAAVMELRSSPAEAPPRPHPARALTGRSGDAEIVHLGIQLILDGGLDDDNGEGLAARVGVSHRQLRRLFQTHAGITPDQLARSSRAHFARRMLADTDLSVPDVAFASGFGSLRQFDRTMYAIFRATPLALRARRRVEPHVADGGLVVRIGSCTSAEWEFMLALLRTQAIAGVENIDRNAYRRTFVIDGDVGAFEVLRGASGELSMRAHLPDWRNLLDLVEKVRRAFHIGVDVDAAVDSTAEMRHPGTWDPFELGVRAIIEQRDAGDEGSLAWRMSALYGQQAPGFSSWELTHTFPSAPVLAHADLDGIGLTATEMTAVRTFAEAVVDGDIRLDGSVPFDDIIQSFLAIPGVERSTAEYVATRVCEANGVMPDRWAAQGRLRHFLGQRRSQRSGSTTVTRMRNE